MATVNKTIECPRCDQDITFMIEIYADCGDLCWDAPGVVQCQMCGEDVDINTEVKIKVEAYV